MAPASKAPLLTSDAGGQLEATADGSPRPHWTRLTTSLGLLITSALAASVVLWSVGPRGLAVTDKSSPQGSPQVIRGLPVDQAEGHSFQPIPGFEFAEADLMSWSGKKQASLHLPTTVQEANDVLTRFKIRNAEAIFQTIPKDNIEALFKDFLSTIGSTAAHREPRTTFDSPEEYSYRLGIFSQFILLVLKQNEFAQVHATHPDHARHGITVFADWTPDEFNSLFPKTDNSFFDSSTSVNEERESDSITLVNSSASIEALKALPCSQVMVHPARTQGSCGSCWAFSVAETIRFTAQAQDGVDPGAISAEYLIDCFKRDCHGSHAYLAMDFVRDHGGIPTVDDYGPALSIHDAQARECKAKPFYTHLPGKCVTGHNMQTYMGKTVEECQAICDTTPTCVAFEYGVDHGSKSTNAKPNGICIPNDSVVTSGCDGIYFNLDVWVMGSGFYTKKPSACVGGHNMAYYKDKTIEECEEICDKTSGCMAFEYGVDHGGRSSSYPPGVCVPNDSANDEGCDGNLYNLDLYVKADLQPTARLSKPFKVTGEAAYAEALCKYGALTIAIFSSPALHSYHSGVLDGATCPTKGTATNHIVTLVGLDAKHGVFIMRNSWGKGWGVDPVTYKSYGGHALMRYGENTCTLATWGAWAVGPVEVVKSASCPADCRGSDCADGIPSHGGKPIEGNHCKYRCSHTFVSGQRFCGTGPRFEKPGSVDCSGC